mgnify:FL=1
MAHNLLTRRRLIGAAGLGMAGIVSGPLRAAVKPAFRWQDEAATPQETGLQKLMILYRNQGIMRPPV